MERLKLLSGLPYEVNSKIIIRQPIMGEIRDYGENEYLDLVSSLTATSYDYRFQLDDMGKDYEDIDDFTMFCMVAPRLPQEETAILFGDLDFTRLEPMIRNDDDIVLRDEERDITIDQIIYELTVKYLRDVHGLERNYKVAGNKAARKFYMVTERKELEEKIKNQNGDKKSIYSSIISALVNSSEFKYNYETVWDLPIYTFMDGVKQVQKMINYKNLMTGVYTGNVDSSKLDKKDLTWIGEQ